MDLYTLKQSLTRDTKTASDHHFGHNALFEKYEPIRAKTSQNLNDFEKTMRNRWNNSVAKTDTFLHLGDFCINKMNDKTTIKNIENNSSLLHGKKILIKGNHDKSENSLYLNSGWDYIIDKPHILLDDEMSILDTNTDFTGCIIMEINKKRIMFSHFGIFTYDKRFELKYKEQFDFLKKLYDKYNCDINIHGHSHSNSNFSKKSYNVSVENINFTPLSIGDIIMRTILFKEK